MICADVIVLQNSAVRLKYFLLNETILYHKYSLSKVLENNLACLDWDSGIVADRTAPHNHSDVTVFEKTDQIVYLFDVSVQNSGNSQTAYAKKIRKYAELSTGMKKHSQVEAVYV